MQTFTPFLVNSHPQFVLLKIIIGGSIDSIASKCDDESPWKISQLLLTSSNFSPLAIIFIHQNLIIYVLPNVSTDSANVEIFLNPVM